MNNIPHYSVAAGKYQDEPSLFSPEFFRHVEANMEEIRDAVDSGRWMTSKWCESFTGKFVEEVKKSRVFADIGADTGFYTYLAVKHMPPGGKIFVFEPDPVKYVFLQKFYRDYPQVTVSDYAISDDKGILEFSKPKKQSATMADVEGEKISVKAITLDEIMGDEKPDLIKIDVEGGEAHVFKGMKNILAQKQARIFLELHYWVDELSPGGKSSMERALADYGYEIENFDTGQSSQRGKLDGVRFYLSPGVSAVKAVPKVRLEYPPLRIGELVLNYTSLCNGKCTYCTIWKNKKGPELVSDSFGNIFSARQLKTLESCYVTGGEPYISDKVLEIASAMHRYIPGSMLTGASNGILLRKTLERAVKIRNMGVKMQLQVSLNGRRETHDFTRGIQGCWAKAVTLIDQLIENNIETCPTFSVMPQTIMDLPYMRLFCKSRKLPLEIAWVRQSSRYDKVDTYFSDWPEVIKPRLKMVEELPDYFDCPALQRRLTVNPDGSVYPCEIFREELYLGNVNERALEEILDDPHTHEVHELIKARKCTWCQGTGEIEGNPKWMVMDCYRRQSPAARTAVDPAKHALYADPETAEKIVEEMLAPLVNIRPESVDLGRIPEAVVACQGRKEFRLVPLEIIDYA